MHAARFLKLKVFSFESIYIVENRDCWERFKDKCSIANDLVLCVDFGLKKDLEQKGYSVQFLDHLVSKHVLDKGNFEVMNFLNEWFNDSAGNDLLEFNGYKIGEALLLNILDTVTYYSHFFFNINSIRSLEYKNLYVSVNDQIILKVISDIGFRVSKMANDNAITQVNYSFPIRQWMYEKLNKISFKERVKDFCLTCVDKLNDFSDRFTSKDKTLLYIQVHYPTRRIIEYFERDKKFRVLLSNYTGIKKMFCERRIPLNKSNLFASETKTLLQKYKSATRPIWEYDGYPISDFLYSLINPIVESQVPLALSKIQSLEKYFSKNTISLMIPITHLWLDNKLFINYCKKNNVPIFTIINGLLNLSFWNDAKGGDYVNSYSQSIKEDYFRNEPNVFPLGDPRMDDYVGLSPKGINRESPTILIGAAGFDLLDLNSYLAFEFDFLYDILEALYSLKDSRKFNIVLKVRPNGYSDLYEKFLIEYFPDLNVKIIQNLPFNQVVAEADLYLTFYSQTVFEASCLGIPVIYYKKDTQTVDRPFDGESELVTAFDVKTLVEKFAAFYNNDPIFNSFLDKVVMEKYIGPLDGNNTMRNINFIKSLISNGDIK